MVTILDVQEWGIFSITDSLLITFLSQLVLSKKAKHASYIVVIIFDLVLALLIFIMKKKNVNIFIIF